MQGSVIELLCSEGAELCVVGDDDQAIYQWRGADVGNILKFSERRQESVRIELLENRRSRPDIISAASSFAASIVGRIPKAMKMVRERQGESVCLFEAETDEEEAEVVADTIERLRADGFGYRDCAILLRSAKNSGGPFFKALAARGIPFEAGGRSGLFATPALDAMGEVYAYLSGISWRDGAFGATRDPDMGIASAKLADAFAEGGAPKAEDIVAYVHDWKRFYEKLNTKAPDLVADYYRFLDFLGIRGRDNGRPNEDELSGSLARFSTVLADYEHAARRGRFHDEEAGQVYRPGLDHGKSYWFGLGTYLAHYAVGAYEDFVGESEAGGSCVRVLTIHQAKGLEWPIVFIPCLVEGRFPSSRTGEEGDWPFPESVMPLEKRLRYEGSDADERRLFYVAMTRARDALYLSTFSRKKRNFKPSAYFLELSKVKGITELDAIPLPVREDRKGGQSATDEISFSDAALWNDCGQRYRLSRILGYEQSLAEELGYGHAVHHTLRVIAEETRSRGRLPTKEEAVSIAKNVFYAPYADESSRERMLSSVEHIVDAYLREYPEDLERAWAVERPFELHADGGTVTGRADLIVDKGEGAEERLALVDYKIADDPTREERYEWQLRVYALAGRREGKHIEAAYLHALRDGTRRSVSLGESELIQAEARAVQAIKAIHDGSFPPRPSADRCLGCDFKTICTHRDSSICEEER
jgi:DNA helicase-2/ATP-dependent DNA helicase PcrA